ncbi:hypothetical protein ACFC0M_00755 [Streptomyces sp. NPDC056149]|uniref:hypothetical protein n=1 Tax=Streptomyces sp. NPDC056149 TaxID=3345728 RepID=UPI0035E1094E
MLLPRPVEDHVQAAGGQRAQFDGDFVARPQQAGITADAGLVGDDERAMQSVFDASGGTYGSPKIWITPVREG